MRDRFPEAAGPQEAGESGADAELYAAYENTIQFLQLHCFFRALSAQYYTIELERDRSIILYDVRAKL